MPDVNEWITDDHARAYLERADGIVNRQHGEAMVQDLVAPGATRILDLGTGDGRLLALLLATRPAATGVALDFSPVMLDQAARRFAANPGVAVVAHNLDEPLPDLGQFDTVVSSFAIHHLTDARKHALYAEILACLTPGGVFVNLEHVAPPSAAVHERWAIAMGRRVEDDDPSNRCAPATLQVGWLRELGFVDSDCYWKWYELAVLAGWKPTA